MIIISIKGGGKNNRRSFDSLRSLRMTDIFIKGKGKGKDKDKGKSKGKSKSKSSRRSFDSLRSLRMTDILYKRQRQRQKQPQVLRLPSVAQDDSFLGVIKNEKPSGEAIEPSYAPPSKEPSKRHPRIFSWTNTAPPSRE